MEQRLAVARLAEIGEAACGCRLRADRAVEGYCLVAGGRLTLYVENGRTLTERSPEGLFYYEGWVLTGEGPISLGVFNTGPAGDCSATCVVEGGLLERAVGIRVTAEPHGGSIAGHRPVLDGRLIWLQQPEHELIGGPVTEPELETMLALPPEPDHPAVAPTVERLPDAQWRPAHQSGSAGGGPPWSEVLSRAGAVAEPEDAAQAQAAPGGVPDTQSHSAPGGVPDTQSHSAPGGVPDTQSHFAPGGVPDTQSHSAPGGVPQTQATPGVEVHGAGPPEAAPAPGDPPAPEATDLSLYPEPATMVTTVVPVTRNVALSNVHPMAPRAVGAAVVRLREGQVTLTLRGLPAPPALGRDPATDRPFNAYRVWLFNQRTGQGTALGICERLWGESYRYQSEPGLVLTRHDTLLVTAGDRNEIDPSPHGARVLLGTFQGA